MNGRNPGSDPPVGVYFQVGGEAVLTAVLADGRTFRVIGPELHPTWPGTEMAKMLAWVACGCPDHAPRKAA